MQDAELARAVAAGDHEAFATLYDRYASSLHDFCASVLRDAEEARDAVQDTFILAWERAGQLRDPTKLRAWLFAIARHEALRRAQARQRVTPIDDAGAGVAAPGADPSDTVSRDDAAAIVWAAAAGLSERDRVLLDLHVRQGLVGQELADAIGVTTNHVHVLVTRLRDRVDRSLGALLVARLGREDCEELQHVLEGWDGTFSPLWRKRVARHVDDCDVCSERRRTLASPFTLLSALAAVMLPSDLREQVIARVRLIASGRAVPTEQRSHGWSRRRDGFPPPLYISPRRRLVAAAVLAAIVIGGGSLGAALVVDVGDRPTIVSAGRATTTSRGPASVAPPTTSAAHTGSPSTSRPSPRILGPPGTAASDTTGPAITSVTANPGSIIAGGGSGCENNQSIVTVSANDPAGVSSVAVSWAVGSQSGSAPAQGGGYRVGPLSYQAGLNDTPVVLTITARDGRGNATTITNTTALRASTCFF